MFTYVHVYSIEYTCTYVHMFTYVHVYSIAYVYICTCVFYIRIPFDVNVFWPSIIQTDKKPMYKIFTYVQNIYIRIPFDVNVFWPSIIQTDKKPMYKIFI